MREPQHHEVPPCSCPHCGKVNDRATGFSDQEGPKPGDITLCMGCVEPSLFTDELGLRKLTPEELQEVEKNDHFRKVRMLLAMSEAASWSLPN